MHIKDCPPPSSSLLHRRFVCCSDTQVSAAVHVDAPGDGYHHAMASVADVCGPTTGSSLKFHLLCTLFN